MRICLALLVIFGIAGCADDVKVVQKFENGKSVSVEVTESSSSRYLSYERGKDMEVVYFRKNEKSIYFSFSLRTWDPGFYGIYMVIKEDNNKYSLTDQTKSLEEFLDKYKNKDLENWEFLQEALEKGRQLYKREVPLKASQ